jgi:anaerobic dimethyl sulfoxide reductase subunit A
MVEDGRVTRVTNNPAGGKYLKGCLRGFSQPAIHNAEERILTPLIRSGPRGAGQFRAASWDEALSLTARRLSDIRARYSASAVLNLGSAGDTGALHSTHTLLDRFLNLFGGCTRLSSNYSNGAAGFVLPYVLGEEFHAAGFDAATMQSAEMIVLWGANVLEARLGSEIPQQLVEARQRGAQIVVVDPRRSGTAQQVGTWWLPCRPGTDAALMLAVLNVLSREERLERDFIAAHSVGFAQLEGYVLGWDGGQPRSPEWAEAICGVPAGEIVRFARAYAAARPAMLLPGYSIQRSFAGEETYRLTVALQVATGNFGARGGSTGAISNFLPAPRVGKMPVLYLENPTVRVVRWPDAVLEGRRGGYPTDIHAVYSVGGNFANQGADHKKNLAALQTLDFAVAHEFFLTPTAQACDVVFPAATPFEKEDIGLPWLGNYLLYRPQAVTPRGQARSDYDIFCELADRLGFLEAFSEGRSAGEWVQRFIDQSEIADAEAFRRTGIYLGADQERVGLADFRADPLGHPLSTPSGKVQIASDRYQRDTGFPAFPTWQPPPADNRYPLRLISPKSKHFTHSQGSNLPALQERAPRRLELHPQDAAARGIAEGDLVRIFNERGEVKIAVRLSADITPGVVCLLEGAWADLDADGVDRAGAANLLTSTEGTRPGVANIMHGVGVEVGRVVGRQLSVKARAGVMESG